MVSLEYSLRRGLDTGENNRFEPIYYNGTVLALLSETHETKSQYNRAGQVRRPFGLPKIAYGVAVVWTTRRKSICCPSTRRIVLSQEVAVNIGLRDPRVNNPNSVSLLASLALIISNSRFTTGSERCQLVRAQNSAALPSAIIPLTYYRLSNAWSF